MLTIPMHAVTAERYQELTLSGFVHVTGLQQYKDGKPEGGPIGRDLDATMFGSYNIWNGQQVIVTYDGQVWLAEVSDQLKRPFGRVALRGLIPTLCPNGQNGVRVPCSNGEIIPFEHIMMRLADPNCNLNPRVELALPGDDATN